MTTLEGSTRRGLFQPLTFWLGGLGVIMLLGLLAAIQVLFHGLELTGLNDQVPWGLWITIDLSSIALGAGAFTFSAVVYVFRIKRFAPIARPAVFVGFLGYTSAMLALFMDIGRPDRFWHPLVYWNVHSVLWEITWCVVLYSFVLVVEFLPVLFESNFFDRWPRVRKFGHLLHRTTPVVAVLGMGLSLLHQSSLGATYGVLSGRAIWFKPSLPVMFILSAIAGGMALTLLATLVTGELRHRRFISERLERDIARIIGYVLLGYLYLKLWDWAATSYYSQTPGAADVLGRLNATTPYTLTFWWLEIVFGGLVPVFLLLFPHTRRNTRFVLLGTALIVFSVIINRWNTTLSGLVAPPNWSPGVIGSAQVATYVPTLVEVAVGLGIVSYALAFFTIGARFLPVFRRVKGRDLDE